MTPMAVYVYAITDGVGDVSDLRGLHDEPLRAVAVGSVVVVIGHAVERVTATRELLADRFDLEDHGIVDVRGKGAMQTWFLLRRRAAAKAG